MLTMGWVQWTGSSRLGPMAQSIEPSRLDPANWVQSDRTDWIQPTGPNRLDPDDWNQSIGFKRLAPVAWTLSIEFCHLGPIQSTRLDQSDGSSRRDPSQSTGSVDWIDPVDWISRPDPVGLYSRRGTIARVPRPGVKRKGGKGGGHGRGGF